MAMLLRLLRWGVSVAALAGAAVFAAAYYFASRSLPDYSAVRPVAGVTDAVEILRDAHAAPHVFAKTEGDVFFGLGYAHAQDRLWQMEFRRRIAQGRLADLFGPAARLAESLGLAPAGGGGAEGLSQRLAEIDAVARGFDLYGASERSLGALSPSARRALEAYSAGVNAWLAEVDREALGRGAPELMALQASVSPWRPVDSVAAFKLLAATLSAPSLITELRRARYLVAQGPTRTEDLFPDAEAPPRMAPPPYKAAAAPAGAARAEAADAATPTAAETAEGLAALGLLFGPAQPQAPARPADAALAALFPFPFSADAAAFAGASNAWAVSGRRSATRAPLLATDPHLPLSAPSIWHLARLEFGDGGVIGGTIAGIPAVLIGRNERIAWGLTTLSADVADVYIEKLNPENPNEYLTPDGPRPFETRETLISLGGGEAVRARLRRTRHGPVLPLAWPGLGGRAVTQPGEVTPKGAVAAVAWTVFDDADRSLEAALRLMRARSVADARKAFPLVTAPAQHVIVADRRSIGLFTVGKAPLRPDTAWSRGRAPSPGWTGRNDWLGLAPAEAWPFVLNPPGGVVANANNRVTDAPYPRHLGFDWPEEHRYDRLEKRLGEREFHTLSGFQAIQADTVSEMARSVLPLVAAPLWRGRERESGRRREALDRLAAWNGDMDPFLAEPLIFVAWMRALTDRLTTDDLGVLAEDYAGLRPRFVARVYSDRAAAARWCDDLRTAAAEDCAAVASLALDDALETLAESYGDTLATWRWGKSHQAVHRHAPFGFAPALDWIFNIRQETGGGDHTLLRGQMRHRGAAPNENVHGSGLRAVFDFADLDRSVGVISTGQSGHFLSRHYHDLAELWRTNSYRPLSLDRRDAEAGAVGLTRLLPADGP